MSVTEAYLGTRPRSGLKREDELTRFPKPPISSYGFSLPMIPIEKMEKMKLSPEERKKKEGMQAYLDQLIRQLGIRIYRAVMVSSVSKEEDFDLYDLVNGRYSVEKKGKDIKITIRKPEK